MPVDADQDTPVLVAFWTVAVNCCVSPDETLALAGLTVTLTDPGGAIVTGTEAEMEESAALVAVTVAGVLVLIAGAV